MNKIYTILIGLIILALTATSASAAVEKYESSFEIGEAGWSLTDVYVFLEVNEYDDFTNVSVHGGGENYSFDGSTMINKSEINKDIFKVNRKSASLSEITFNVTVNDSQVKPITIKVDWIGEGDVMTGKSMEMFKDGDIYKSKMDGFYREATATGSICLDGSELIGEEPSTFAYFGQADFVEMFIDKNKN